MRGGYVDTVMQVVVPKIDWANGAGEETSFEVGSVYDLLDVIRKKPGLFIGEASITALRAYIDGFLAGLRGIGQRLGDEEPQFDGFFDWIAARYGFEESTIGWKAILLQAAGREDAALARFFEELDEFRLDRIEVFRRAAEPMGTTHRRTCAGLTEELPVQAFEVEGYLRSPVFYLVQILPGERYRSSFFHDIDGALEEAEQRYGISAGAWQSLRNGATQPIAAPDGAPSLPPRGRSPRG